MVGVRAPRRMERSRRDGFDLPAIAHRRTGLTPDAYIVPALHHRTSGTRREVSVADKEEFDRQVRVTASSPSVLPLRWSSGSSCLSAATGSRDDHRCRDAHRSGQAGPRHSQTLQRKVLALAAHAHASPLTRAPPAARPNRAFKPAPPLSHRGTSKSALVNGRAPAVGRGPDARRSRQQTPAFPGRKREPPVRRAVVGSSNQPHGRFATSRLLLLRTSSAATASSARCRVARCLMEPRCLASIYASRPFLLSFARTRVSQGSA